MMFVEVFSPPGTLTREQRRVIGTRFVAELTDPDHAGGAPEQVLAAARRIFQVVFHEADAWFVGGEPIEPDAPPRYMVRASVPESWREETSRHLIEIFTRVLADVDGSERLYEQPHAWVHVIGIPEGGCGALGTVQRSADIVRMITRSDGQAPAVPENLPPGSGFDPVCGMTVPFEYAARVAEHEGTRYAFCSTGCHEVFTEEHATA
jgi:YHS domain-containing protein